MRPEVSWNLRCKTRANCIIFPSPRRAQLPECQNFRMSDASMLLPSVRKNVMRDMSALESQAVDHSEYTSGTSLVSGVPLRVHWMARPPALAKTPYCSHALGSSASKEPICAQLLISQSSPPVMARRGGRHVSLGAGGVFEVKQLRHCCIAQDISTGAEGAFSAQPGGLHARRKSRSRCLRIFGYSSSGIRVGLRRAWRFAGVESPIRSLLGRQL